MKFVKSFIIGFLVLIIVLVAVILFIVNNGNESDDSQNVVSIDDDMEEGTNGEFVDVSGYNNFFEIRGYVNMYLSRINMNSSIYKNQDGSLEDKNSIYKGIIDLLSKEYIDKNNITADNVENFVNKINQDVIFVPLHMKMKGVDNLGRYLVSGFLTDINNGYVGDFSIIVNVDLANETFAIEPVLGTSINENAVGSLDVSIEKNDNNGMYFQDVDDEYISKEYINTFKRIMLSNPKLAYELLDEEYRNKRFGDLKSFTEYIDSNKSFVNSITLGKYLVNDNDGYREYICIDTHGNYYRFNEKSITDYSVMLDLYTVDLEQFKVQYNKGNDADKCSLNIQKFIQMLNAKDYKSAYNVLDDGFKSNYFKSLGAFERYVKDNFFEYSSVQSDVSFSKSGLYYVSNVGLTESGNASNAMTKRFIVSLRDGTSFKLSFTV